MPQASAPVGLCPPTRAAKGTWAPAEPERFPAAPPGTGGGASGGPASAVEAAGDATSQRQGGAQMSVRFPLDRERLEPRLKCPDTPPKMRAGSVLKNRFLYPNQAPCRAPGLSPKADPMVERTAFAPNSCGPQPAQHADGREKIVSAGGQFRGESLQFLHALSRPKSAHAGREPAANFRTAIFSRSNPDPKFFLERRRPSSAHAGSVSAPTVYSGARKEGNGDNSRRQQRPASASAATSSSSQNQVHGATQRPASATVRRHDREEVGNWATRTSQPPTKRPASARPASALSFTRSSRLPPRPVSALGLGIHKSAGSGKSLEDSSPTTAPEIPAADAETTGLESWHEETALDVAVTLMMLGKQNVGIWQKRENSRSVPRALSAGPERVKSKMEEELCEIDPAFFAFSVPGESRREYLDKLERVQKKLHGMLNSSPPRVKTFASRKPRRAMPDSANRLDLIRDQLFERARAGGSRLLSGTRIEGSRMLKTQWSKARVEERLSQYRNEHGHLQLKQKIAGYRQEKEANLKRVSDRSEGTSIYSEYSYSGRRKNVHESMDTETGQGERQYGEAEVNEEEATPEKQAAGNANEQEDTTPKVGTEMLLIPWASGTGHAALPWEGALLAQKEEMEKREQRRRENERANLLAHVALLAKYKWGKEEEGITENESTPVRSRNKSPNRSKSTNRSKSPKRRFARSYLNNDQELFFN